MDGFLLIRRRAIHTPDAVMADAMMPKIPKIHGRRPADCVAGFDCAGLLVGCPVPVVVLPDPGSYPLPGLEFGPELELGPEPDPDAARGPGLFPVPPRLDPLLESELTVGVNRWVRSRVVLMSLREA